MNPKSFELMPEDHAAKPMDRISGSAKILPVLVLYNVRLSDSPTYKTLCAAAHYGGSDPTCIAVYDNSAICHVEPGQQKQVFAFHHDPDNGGLAAAYNWALAIALEHDFEWLLLLDQDTELPLEFLPPIRDAVLLFETEEQVAAIVPRVFGRFGLLSPNRVMFGRLVSVSETVSGIVVDEITAVNSGTLVRTEYVQSIGGFNRDFQLDCLDRWLFHTIYASGKCVAVSPVCLRHDLSVEDYAKNISQTRFRNILESEARFFTRFKSRSERVIYVFRLGLRAAKHAVVHRNLRNAGMVLAAVPWLFRRSSPSHRENHVLNISSGLE